MTPSCTEHIRFLSPFAPILHDGTGWVRRLAPASVAGPAGPPWRGAEPAATRTIARRRRLGPLWGAAVLALVPLARAAVYDFAVPDDTLARTLRLNIPAAVPAVRGLIIYGNGWAGNSRDAATDPELVALAESLGFAVIGTANWMNFADYRDPDELK